MINSPIESEIEPYGIENSRDKAIKSETNEPTSLKSEESDLFPLSDVSVSFPNPKSNLITSVMFYKIEFRWRLEKKSITRRFSEIEKLRVALQALLPFTYIFPVHRKQIIVK